MSSASHEGRSLTAPLAHQVGVGASALAIAQANAGLWQAVDAALSPILGTRGVAALHQRSWHLAAAQIAGLGGPDEGLAPHDSPARFADQIARLSPDAAAAAAQALLDHFHAVLASLVGPALTEQLLQPVWATAPPNAAGDAPPQDTSP